MTFSLMLWVIASMLTLTGLINQCIKWVCFDPYQKNESDDRMIERLYIISDDFVQAQKRVTYFYKWNQFIKRDNIRMQIVHWFLYFTAVQLNSFYLTPWYASFPVSSQKTFLALLPAIAITYMAFYVVNKNFRKKLHVRINNIFDDILNAI